MWKRTGGGCLTEAGGGGKTTYPCDDDWENTKTKERVNIRSTYDRHFDLPEAVKSLGELYSLVGVCPSRLVGDR